MKRYLIFSFLFICSVSLLAQEEDLLSLIETEETTDYVDASFKTTRVINFHSLESTAAGVLDVKISHRFGRLNEGAYALFGLDNATIRLGLDYGITDRLTVGLGRSSFEKTFDGYLKYKILRQSTGKKTMPVTLAALATTSLKTLRQTNPDREDVFSHRMAYTYQLILGRKFSERISFQLSPTLVHRNLVETLAEENDVMAIGAAGRVKLSKRVTLNAEYMYVLPDQLADNLYNSLSIGFDIETGGHVFQLHFTNSPSMIEKGFITETNGNWFDGDIYFGFNISRVFTIVKPKLD